MTLDIVPVVMGGADYKKKAPHKSFIDVLDFESPRKLAEFLLKLDKNDEWWKVSTTIDHF